MVVTSTINAMPFYSKQKSDIVKCQNRSSSGKDTTTENCNPLDFKIFQYRGLFCSWDVLKSQVLFTGVVLEKKCANAKLQYFASAS